VVRESLQPKVVRAQVMHLASDFDSEARKTRADRVVDMWRSRVPIVLP
jgi:hypothetical protein